MTDAERADEYQRLRAESVREAAQLVRQARARARADYVARAYGHAGIPPRFQGRTFDSFAVTCADQRHALDIAQRYARGFGEILTHGTCLTLIGSPGTGKTHLAAAIGQAVIDAGHAVAYRGMSEILMDFRASYRDDGPSEKRVLGDLVAPDLLIIDEIGVALGRRETRQATLFDVFNARYEQRRPTILLGNLTRDELRDELGERIERRVLEGGGPVIPFTWPPHQTRTF